MSKRSAIAPPGRTHATVASAAADQPTVNVASRLKPKRARTSPVRSFRESDVKKALLGARAGGMVADEVRISPEGEIRILARRDDTVGSNTARDVQDELAKHFGHGRA